MQLLKSIEQNDDHAFKLGEASEALRNTLPLQEVITLITMTPR
jgi:hypothetical protein